MFPTNFVFNVRCVSGGWFFVYVFIYVLVSIRKHTRVLAHTLVPLHSVNGNQPDQNLSSTWTLFKDFLTILCSFCETLIFCLKTYYTNLLFTRQFNIISSLIDNRRVKFHSWTKILLTLINLPKLVPSLRLLNELLQRRQNKHPVYSIFFVRSECRTSILLLTRKIGVTFQDLYRVLHPSQKEF